MKLVVCDVSLIYQYIPPPPNKKKGKPQPRNCMTLVFPIPVWTSIEIGFQDRWIEKRWRCCIAWSTKWLMVCLVWWRSSWSDPDVDVQKKPRWWKLKYFFMFTPKIGEDSQFDEHLFQMGWMKPPTRETMAREDFFPRILGGSRGGGDGDHRNHQSSTGKVTLRQRS